MTQIALFIAPGTCARVPLIALEEIGVPFETRLVRFMKGEHKSPAYKRHNPKGKVPTLVIAEEALSENVAIITYLDARFPDARLLPQAHDAMSRAHLISDLCFCATTLHPLVARLRLPHLFAGAEGAASVWKMGAAAMQEYFQLVEDRLAAGPWWYGAAWSAMDAYLYWVFWRVEGAGFDVSPFPLFTAHARRIEARASVQRALAREGEAQRQLEAEGLAFVPPPPPTQASN